MYEVSRSGYYKWFKRKCTLNRYEKQQEELDYYVADLHSHYPSQGYRSLNDTLLNMYGWKVSDVSVWKSMKRLGVSGFVRKKKCSAANEGAEHYRFRNVLIGFLYLIFLNPLSLISTPTAVLILFGKAC